MSSRIYRFNKLQQCLITTPLFVSLLAVSSAGFAGAVTISDASVRGQSMQAFTAVADDPSAVFYNPAGLTQVHGTQLEGNLFYVTDDQRYKSSLTGTGTHSYPEALAPAFYLSTDHFKRITLGLGLYASFARGAHYDRNLATYFLPQKSNLVRTDFSPTFAFNVNEYVSFGGGAVISGVKGFTDILGFVERGNGAGVTGQAGVLVKFPKQVRLGITYRGPETVTLHGHGRYLDIRDGFNGNLNFPTIITSGLSWQANEHFLISANYDYEMWSVLKKFNRNYSNPFLNVLAKSTLNSRNSSTYRLGVRYSYDKDNDFMAGISYINGAVPQAYIIPALPDYSGTNSSIGYSHYFNPRWRVDAMYEYIYGPDRKSYNVTFPGKYAIKGNVFAIGVDYTFT